MSMVSSLYRNVAGSALSVADTIRTLFVAGNVKAIQQVLDSQPASSSTTLCCVNPSSQLIHFTVTHLSQVSKGATVLSIGSGSGLFELLLQEGAQADFKVVGTDVAPINIFLSDKCFYCMQVGQDPSLVVLENVKALVSVYLRRPSLVVEYLKWFTEVEVVLLVGPRNEDPYLDTSVCAELQRMGWKRLVIEDGPVAAWDVVLLLVRN
ncbi:hypothetical protein BDR26DRAFT_1003097 [Obelidium mucronatum]|nr:hypothetical protein BDR26DRAFT_1003097 [Obelidium mucronatum]